MKVIVVGSGIGGISAAYHLVNENHQVILLEKCNEIGGHAYNVEIDGEVVDLGFMMFGDSNPNIKEWFRELGLSNKIDGTTDVRIPMSMSVTSEKKDDLEFSSRKPFNSIRDVFNVQIWRIIVDIYRFTIDLMDMPEKTNLSTKEWAEKNKYSKAFFRHYFLPFVAILWTIPKQSVLDLPASQFLRCLKSHANSLYIPLWQVLLGALGRRVDRPKQLWWFMGAKYRKPFEEYFTKRGGVIKTNASVAKIGKQGKFVVLEDGTKMECDHVVAACHAEITAAMMPWSKQASQLNPYKYHNSMMYVHRDPQFLPEHKKAWGSWNVKITENEEYVMTYWINRIQRLKSKQNVFVTITPFDFHGNVPDPSTVLMKFPWDHPCRLADCIPQSEILNEDGITLSGAWLGRGFHEDGFVAGRRAASIVDNPDQHKYTELYADPGNIPAPKVPPFVMPWSIYLGFTTIATAMASATIYTALQVYAKHN